MRYERRYLSMTGPDGAGLTVNEESGKRTIQGYAAVFNSLSSDLGDGKKQVREVIRSGAFAPLLARGADVRALIDHEPSKILGRTKPGTLRLEEDSRGLRFEIDPPDTQASRDLCCSMQRGDIDGASFGFKVAPGGDAWRSENGCYVREIRQFESLSDVSVVTYPAYPATEACFRSLREWENGHPRETRSATLGDLAFGDNVQWWQSDFDDLSAYLCYGQIAAVKADGPLAIDGTPLSLIGTEDDPAALVIAGDDGDGTYYLRPFSQLTKLMPAPDFACSLRSDYDRLRLLSVAG